ncbi:response regulator [Bradyrhizobium sp. 190]|uniref:response regulator transcription factor n=1 Tax=Bradyrhizobium sp. 190 TaxID=2782658 RepID=UPI0027E1C8E9|nr:response regulator [Bradyrhizobium sp. 190]
MLDADVVESTVHVVDDDPSFRTALERRLRTAGYIVATYSSAEQLLNDLSDYSGLGCIILDVRLPGLSGPELQGRLRELGATLPILFLTGYPDIPTTVNTIKPVRKIFWSSQSILTNCSARSNERLLATGLRES